MDVVYQGDHGYPSVERGEERHPVTDVDEDVRPAKSAAGQPPEAQPTREVGQRRTDIDGVSPAAAYEPYAVGRGLVGRRVSVGGAEHRDPVAGRHEL
jgi:hypothetical protein